MSCFHCCFLLFIALVNSRFIENFCGSGRINSENSARNVKNSRHGVYLPLNCFVVYRWCISGMQLWNNGCFPLYAAHLKWCIAVVFIAMSGIHLDADASADREMECFERQWQRSFSTPWGSLVQHLHLLLVTKGVLDLMFPNQPKLNLDGFILVNSARTGLCLIIFVNSVTNN